MDSVKITKTINNNIKLIELYDLAIFIRDFMTAESAKNRKFCGVAVGGHVIIQYEDLLLDSQECKNFHLLPGMNFRHNGVLSA